MGVILSFFGTASARLVGLAIALAVWLLSRPGGWAVLVVLVLFGLRVFPNPPE